MFTLSKPYAFFTKKERTKYKITLISLNNQNFTLKSSIPAKLGYLKKPLRLQICVQRQLLLENLTLLLQNVPFF